MTANVHLFDSRGEKIASPQKRKRYLLHAPLSLDRMQFDEDTGHVMYRSKHHRAGSQGDSYDPLDFLARLLMHVPEPRLHRIRYGRFALLCG